MLLDQAAWVKLIKGVTAATINGELKWHPRDTGDMSAPYASMLRSVSLAFSPARTMIAMTKNTVYQLSSDPFGRSPYEFIIFDRSGKNTEPIARYKSSTTLLNPSLVNLDAPLEALHKAASDSIETPEVVVDRLLGELGQD